MKLSKFDMEMLTNGDGFGTRELKPIGIETMRPCMPPSNDDLNLICVFQKHHSEDESLYAFNFKRIAGKHVFNEDEPAYVLGVKEINK